MLFRSEDVVGHLVPELQKRGAYATAYKPGTLREKLFGEGPYLQSNHLAAQYRDIEVFKQGEASHLLSVPEPTLVAE